MRSDLFMITCSARTGSTLLQTFLASHPDTLVHGEVYVPNRVAALSGIHSPLVKDEEKNALLTEFRDHNQPAFLYKYIYDAQGHKVVGHKLKHEELLLPKFAETREAVRKDTDIKIVTIYRRNLFERFVSWWLVNHVTGVTMITEKDEKPEFHPVSIPINRCREDFDQTLGRYQFFSNFFSKHQTFALNYEDLLGDNRDQILGELQEFLGIDAISLSSPLKKVAPKDIRSLIINFDEIVDHFKGTKYEEFFIEEAV